MAQNDKKLCLSDSIPQEALYNHDFLYTYVKRWHLRCFFHFFKILIFLGFTGVKGQNWPQLTKKICLSCLISQEHIVWKGISAPSFFFHPPFLISPFLEKHATHLLTPLRGKYQILWWYTGISETENNNAMETYYL